MVLASWHSTIIVRKDGAVPENVKDGTIVMESSVKNQYKDTEFIDESGLEDGHTYYYRFFTRSTKGIIGDGSPSVKMTVKLIDPVLANNDWNTIIEVAESGAASETWSIGDEIDVALSGTYNETVTLQIWDFGHYDKTDGTGKTGITFGMKNLLSVVCYGWDTDGASNRFLNDLPEVIKNSIKEIIHKRSEHGLVKEYNVKVHIPTGHEIGLTMSGRDIKDGVKFPIFTDAKSRIKNYSAGGNTSHWWWTETKYTMVYGSTPEQFHLLVGDDGGTEAISFNSQNATSGFCAVFDI